MGEDMDKSTSSTDKLNKEIAERKRIEKKLKATEEQAEQTNRQLEAAIEQANLMVKEAIAANDAKSQFLANISHEIRTPMNAIIGFSDILAEEQITGNEREEYISLIRESSKHLSDLMNNILDFSEIEIGKLHVEITECSLAELFDTIESLMKHTVEKKGLSFEIIQLN